MRTITVVIIATMITCVAGCTDKAKADYERCLKLEKEGDVHGALLACRSARAQDPNSVSGRAASEKVKELDLLDAEQRAQEAERENRIATQRRAAQAAQDAKCSRWMTICTLGRFPDGSERTTGAQYFKTKSACESTGPDMGLRCDPCRCMD